MLNLMVRVMCVGALAVPVQIAKADDVKPPQKDSKDAAQAAPSKEPEKRTAARTATQQPASAGGVVVFVDPATGKIRQPSPSEIGVLVGTTPPAAAPAVPTIHGPGGAIGMKLDDNSLVYTVVTKAPDGKLATECVEGGKAAATRVAGSGTSKAKEGVQGPKKQ